MKLYEYLGKPKDRANKGDVGVEIEVEGERLPANIPGDRWIVENDGSLRGGKEYIFNGPQKHQDVAQALQDLNDTFEKKKSVLDFSFRTSVHVHVNCLNLEYTQILNFIYTYMLMEPVLMNFAGEGRKANRFCLRLEDGEGLMYTIKELMQANREEFPMLHGIINKDAIRYASLNIGALLDHGTLEVRSMRGNCDPGIILPWVEALLSLRTFAKAHEDPKDIYDVYRDVGSVGFAKLVLGDLFDTFDYEGLRREMDRAASLTIEIPHLRVGGKQVKKPVPVQPKKIARVRLAQPVDVRVDGIADVGGGNWNVNPFAPHPAPIAPQGGVAAGQANVWHFNNMVRDMHQRDAARARAEGVEAFRQHMRERAQRELDELNGNALQAEDL
jgi:hypothetical protein